ncbi:TIR domain-containing protein [Nonomuraea gerenzanensis]|uniref:hypothetical protein n=1 Tax=Nonomuraea gerenzanensis TaxID=93944 RepID=UPI001CDA4E69|nr:hypothetical protein [Nonomuraea gerenzanensis]UBU13238.1 hypothetical protein LCN96_54905 [Nonomuraea gerenzanensis]
MTCRSEGVHVVRDKTILDTLVLVSAGISWTTPPGEPVSYPQPLTPEEELADAKKRLSLPPIVVICGSTRFMAEMTEADLRETTAGKIVVKPGCDMKSPHELWSDPAAARALKVRLDDLHRAKIRLADEVLVVGDHIGDSTRAEIAYARSLGKPVRFTHPEVDPDA